MLQFSRCMHPRPIESRTWMQLNCSHTAHAVRKVSSKFQVHTLLLNGHQMILWIYWYIVIDVVWRMGLRFFFIANNVRLETISRFIISRIKKGTVTRSKCFIIVQFFGVFLACFVFFFWNSVCSMLIAGDYFCSHSIIITCGMDHT